MLFIEHMFAWPGAALTPLRPAATASPTRRIKAVEALSIDRVCPRPLATPC